MKLSAVVPCYNAADTIGEQLEALADQRWSEQWEIIVVDNGSTDRSASIVQRYARTMPRLRLVDGSKRRGEPHARNVGVQAAKSEAVAFCDADDVVAPGWVRAMGEALAEHDFVACGLEREKLNEPWTHIVSGNPQRDGLQRLWYPPYCVHAGGGTLGVRRAVHNLIGGFDESWPILCDTDYCIRMSDAGVALHFVPGAVIHIRYRHTLRGIFSQARRVAEANVRLYRKHRVRDGLDGRRWRQYARNWMRWLRWLPQECGHRKGRATVAMQLGWQVGFLVGTVKYRVPPPELVREEAPAHMLAGEPGR